MKVYQLHGGIWPISRRWRLARLLRSFPLIPPVGGRTDPQYPFSFPSESVHPSKVSFCSLAPPPMLMSFTEDLGKGEERSTFSSRISYPLLNILHFRSGSPILVRFPPF